MRKPKVLVADDDNALLELMTSRVKRMGLEADAAGDGRAALIMLERNTYDVVVADIYMPEATGIDILIAAKQHDPNIQVVIVTAAATLDNAVEALNKGAFNYLTKPFDHLSVFDRAVSQALEFRKLTLDNIRMAEIQRRRGDLLEEEVTERIQQLRKRGRDLPDLLASLPIGILVMESDGRVVLSNPVAEKWLAVEWRDANRPIQRYIRAISGGLSTPSSLVNILGRKLQLHFTELPVEGDRRRILLLIQEADQALSLEMTQLMEEPLENTKRGLAWLYQENEADSQKEVIRFLAAQIERLDGVRKKYQGK